jgi:hypothetical protein
VVGRRDSARARSGNVLADVKDNIKMLKKDCAFVKKRRPEIIEAWKLGTRRLGRSGLARARRSSPSYPEQTTCGTSIALILSFDSEWDGYPRRIFRN